jgi:SSS family solute:Na+ symporter
MLLALNANSFGGVIGLLILWFGALVGPIAIPMLLGMLPPLRRSGPSAAIISWAAGLVVFAAMKYLVPNWIASFGNNAQAVTVAAPIVISIILFVLIGFIKPEATPASDRLLDSINGRASSDEPVLEGTPVA